MSVKLSPIFNAQVMDGNGDPASGWKIYTYAAGSSSLLPTYTDSTGTVANANPIVLDTLGFSPNEIWLTSGLSYQFVLTDADGVEKRTMDDISGVNDTSISTSQWNASNVTPTYINATSFSVPGDQTSEFHIGRRLQLTTTAGTVYGKITNSVYGTVTTVTVSLDSGTLDSGLSAVNLSILRADHNSLPTVPKASFGTNDGTIASASFVQDAIFAITSGALLNPNGTLPLSNGWILNWGTGVSTGAASFAVTMATPFPNQALFKAVFPANGASFGVSVQGSIVTSDTSKTAITVNLSSATSGVGYAWIAIGK